jgi:hypothetical protein
MKQPGFSELRDESHASCGTGRVVDPIEKGRGPLAAGSEVYDSYAAILAILNERLFGREGNPVSFAF